MKKEIDIEFETGVPIEKWIQTGLTPRVIENTYHYTGRIAETERKYNTPRTVILLLARRWGIRE